MAVFGLVNFFFDMDNEPLPVFPEELVAFFD